MSWITPTPGPVLLARSDRPAISSFRWIILSLLVLATSLNYLDRLILAVLGPEICRDFKIDDAQYGHIMAAFAISYAIGQVVAGGWLDRVGTRIGFAVSLVAWSLASLSHAFMRTALGFGISRSALGIAESPNFPAATKTIAEWFPRRERAFAMGWVNAGSNFGSILAPLVVLKLADSYGWQWAFVITSAGGLLWVALWLPIYRKPAEHPRVSADELALINSDAPEPTVAVPWHTLLSYRQTWAFGVGKFFTDAVFWFFLTWTPKVFATVYHVKIDLAGLGPPLVIIASMAAVGSIAGGGLSSTMIRRGVGVNVARKMAMLVCAVHIAGGIRGQCRQRVDGGVIAWLGVRGASRFFVQSIYAGIRYVSAAHGWIRGGSWRRHGMAWRGTFHGSHGAHSGMDPRQLYAFICHVQFLLPCAPGHHPNSIAKAGAGGDG